jgi:hypothetical protein
MERRARRTRAATKFTATVALSTERRLAPGGYTVALTATNGTAQSATAGPLGFTLAG